MEPCTQPLLNEQEGFDLEESKSPFCIDDADHTCHPPRKRTQIVTWFRRLHVDFHSTFLTIFGGLKESNTSTAISRLNLRTIMAVILPAFLQRGGLKSPATDNPTAYLDAVRGFAAVTVCHTHFFRSDARWSSLPILNLYHQGALMVDIFFIISGYVLTRKMLDLVRRRREIDFLTSLSSAVFRRYLRLYLSSAIASFIGMLAVGFGLSGHYAVKRHDTFVSQLAHWLKDMLQFSNPFTHTADAGGWDAQASVYNHNLWTIPVEFRGSLHAFLFVLACCRTTHARRKTICWILIAASMIWASTYSALFLFGVFLAERSLPVEAQLKTTSPVRSVSDFDQKREKSSGPSTMKYITSGLILLLGLLLGGQPDNLGREGDLPWPYLSRFIPYWWPNYLPQERHFWLTLSAGLILYGLDSCKPFQRPFTLPFSQYIGRLSFGIYVMQVPVDGLYWMSAARGHLGPSFWGKLTYFFLFWFVLLWVSDYFSRIDTGVIKFVRWLESKSSTNY